MYKKYCVLLCMFVDDYVFSLLQQSQTSIRCITSKMDPFTVSKYYTIIKNMDISVKRKLD